MKIIRSLLIITLLLALPAQYSCKKELEEIRGCNKIEIGNTTATDLSFTTAAVKTNNIITAGNIIYQHGHCWNTDPYPEISDHKTELGKNINSDTFESYLDNLYTNTKYYVRPYMKIEYGVVYGSEINFTTLTPGIPAVLRRKPLF